MPYWIFLVDKFSLKRISKKKKLSIYDSNVTILFEQNTSIQKNINIDKGVCMELTVFWDEWGMTSIQDFMSGFTFKVYSLHCFLYV